MEKNYFKIIWRNAVRQPVHSALNLTCLSVGIAGALLILLYISFELTYDRYNSRSDRIYRVTTRSIRTHEKTINVEWNSTPAPLGPAIERDIAGVDRYTRLFQFWTSEDVKIRHNGKVLQEKNVYAADSTVFSIFSFDFVAGDPGRALSGPDKMVISESLARRIFGDEDPVGKLLQATVVHSKADISAEHSIIVTGVYRDELKLL